MSNPQRGQSSLPWWVTLIVAIGAVLMGLGAIIALVKPAMLVAPGEAINGAVTVYAGYLFSRNLAIAAMMLGALIVGARGALGNFTMLAALVQAADAVLDCVEGRWVLVPGVAVLGVALFFAARRVQEAK